MKIAITGGTGFVGRHLARALVNDNHSVILLARGVDERDKQIRNLPRAEFVASSLDNVDELIPILKGCDAVAHCAGINREIGRQTYQKVHVEATQNIIQAAMKSDVNHIVLLSFLRARPDCGSAYHESKWAAEEIVRASGLSYTIIKAGMIYGKGDHMLDHLSHTLHTVPLFAIVGLREKPIRPVCVDDVVKIIKNSFDDVRLSKKTFAVTGPQEMFLSDTVKEVARVLGKDVKIFPLPAWFHYTLAWVCEHTMKIPLISIAQVRMLTEGITQTPYSCDPLPAELEPQTLFDAQQIQKGLPEPVPFGSKDCLI